MSHLFLLILKSNLSSLYSMPYLLAKHISFPGNSALLQSYFDNDRSRFRIKSKILLCICESVSNAQILTPINADHTNQRRESFIKAAGKSKGCWRSKNNYSKLISIFFGTFNIEVSGFLGENLSVIFWRSKLSKNLF